MPQYRIQIDTKTNEVKRHGYDDHKMTLALYTPTYIVVHCASGSHWSGIGFDQGYDPASFEVYKIDDQVNEDEYNLIHITATKLVEFEVKARGVYCHR